MLRDVLIRLLLSAIGIFIGVTAFFVFFVHYGNYDTGFWSLLSGALAAVCFHLHWVTGNDSLETWHTTVTLRNLNIVGFLGAVAGITAFIWYLFLTFYHKIPVYPISDSTLISAVWAMTCAKWGIFLAYHSHKYELLIRGGSLPILVEGST